MTLRPQDVEALRVVSAVLEAGAYLVGVDAARLARPKSREVVRTFLARFTDEYAELVSRVLAEEQRSHSEHRRVEVYRLFRVFKAHRR